MSTTFWIFYGLLLLMTLAAAYLLRYSREQHKLLNERLDTIISLSTALIDEKARHERATLRIAAMTKTEKALALAVAPLIEKTDWMTGRWGGKFNSLVAMENARNAAVDRVRKSLMELPTVNDFTERNKTALLHSIVDQPVWQ